ncbi:MAG: FlgD immunoglobulin-like domain containing protein [Candidatus Poribacteria bacterium]
MATGRQIQGDNRLVCCTSTLLEAYQLVVVTETNQYEMSNKSKIRLTGEEAILRLQPRRTIPTETVLMVNYPNPFNPETWIPFELNQDSNVSLAIYDLAGRLVRRLDLGFQEAGAYLQRDRAIYWDGRTQSGEQVASGTYFYTLKTEGYVSTQKMIILK